MFCAQTFQDRRELVETGREQADVGHAERVAKTAQLGCDLVDGPDGDDWSRRPNQILAASLPRGPYMSADVVAACAPLLTPLGLRSLGPSETGYRGRH